MLLLPFGMLEGMSSDAEDDLLSPDEEGEHNVEGFMLCTFCASCLHSALARIRARWI